MTMRGVLLLCVLITLSQTAVAQTAYPSRPVRMVVTVQPGGAADLVARIMAQKLGAAFKQVFVVENRSGGGSMAGVLQAARATADGHTALVVSVNSHGIWPNTYAKLPFDPLGDFAPVGLYASMPLIMVVNAQLPVRSVANLIALAQSRPGGISFASGGTASAPHLIGELFKSVSGARIEHVPYKGSGPAAADLAGGQVQLAFDVLAPQMPYIKSGRTRVLAVTTPKRLPVAPDAPTMIEIGYPKVAGTVWYGLMVPAGTPRAVIAKLNAESNGVLATDEVRDRLAAMGIDAAGGGSPEDFGKFIRAEIAKWAPVVRAAGIVPE